MDYEGHLTAREKVRTKKKVIQRIVQKMEENAEGGLAYSGKCYICQSECMDDAKAVAMLVESRFPNLNGKVEIYPIGVRKNKAKINLHYINSYYSGHFQSE